MRATDYSGTGGWSGGLSDDLQYPTARQAKTGMWIFMAVMSSLFMLFILAFMLRSQLGDWAHLSSQWMPLADPWQLYINTFLLACSCVCLYCSQRYARKGSIHSTIKALALAGVFALGFLSGQMLVWMQLVVLGYFVNSNPANSFFYLLTGLHGLHLLGGIVALWVTLRRAWHGGEKKRLCLSIDLCAMYWHYLLLLWAVLLLLLTSSPEAYAAFARWCGF